MSITSTGDQDKELAIPKRYAWETEETLVDERKKLKNRLRRWFTLRRIVLLIIVISALFDAAVMGGISAFSIN